MPIKFKQIINSLNYILYIEAPNDSAALPFRLRETNCPGMGNSVIQQQFEYFSSK
jgi:hypothetical protein